MILRQTTKKLPFFGSFFVAGKYGTPAGALPHRETGAAF